MACHADENGDDVHLLLIEVGFCIYSGFHADVAYIITLGDVSESSRDDWIVRTWKLIRRTPRVADRICLGVSTFKF